MSARLRTLVERLGGQLIGDPEIEVSGIAPLDKATASHITFLSNPKLRAQVAQTGAAVVLGHLSVGENVPISSGSMVSRSILGPSQYTGIYPLAGMPNGRSRLRLCAILDDA